MAKIQDVCDIISSTDCYIKMMGELAQWRGSTFFAVIIVA